jgi:hypothetical protein
MQLSLQNYFDVGYSLGLGDEVFRPNATPKVSPGTQYHVQEVEQVRRDLGLRNPLGEGVFCDLGNLNGGQVLILWRERALAMVNDPEMDLALGLDPRSDKGQAKNRLQQLVRDHPIERCIVTVHAIGAAFIRLDLASGIPPDLLVGILKCYEFAAYTVGVSEAILHAARTTAEAAAMSRGEALKRLSQRPPPVIQTGANNKQESRLLTHGFTPVVLCTDPDDAELVEEVKKRLLGQDADNDVTKKMEPIRFEYHGLLYYHWAGCFLIPLTPEASAPAEATVGHGKPPTSAPPLEVVDRILYCIQISQVFLGTCEAFEKLFLEEIRLAITGPDGVPLRDPGELNRLRTLALAVVGLTRFESAASTHEDAAYFACYGRDAKIEERHRLLLDQCEILHNVENAEVQSQEATRQHYLNGVLLFLTGFTFLSVLADSYSFVRGDEHWLPLVLHRIVIWGSLVALLLMALLALIKVILGRRR